MQRIYTIGYSSFSNTSEFTDAIKKYNITCVIDIRSKPYSEYYKEFNKDKISNTLMSNGILYRHYSKEFGARQKDRRYFSDEGYLDFDLFATSIQFIEGVSKIKKGQEMGYVFVLMCAEKDPIECHRTIMVGKQLSKIGMNVYHIINQDSIESHKELESRLIDNVFPNIQQMSLFDDLTSLDYDSLLQKAYKLKNKEIGFRNEECE